MAVEPNISDSQLHVVMFPFFAFGHVSPFIQLSNKLSSHGVHFSFFTIPGFIPKVKTLIIPASRNIEIIPLEISPTLELPPNLAGTTDLPLSEAAKMITAIDLARPQVETLLSELKPHFVLFDFAQHWLPSLASKLGIKAMYFSVFSAISMAYLTFPARRIFSVEGNMNIGDLLKPPLGFPLRFESEDFVDQSQLISAFEAQELLFLYKSYNDPNSPSNYDRIQEGLASCCAFVIKTCNEMGGLYLDYMNSQLEKPFILTGPLVPEPPRSFEKLDKKWANWLAQFPPKSVIFSSFGSETFLEREQISELALGLEMTGQPFLLVLNFPKGVDSSVELKQALPLDFIERTKDKGLVRVGWVPQQLILGHSSVCCYLCHAGFSSLVEALVNDCQLVLLPLKGDQFLNSRLVGENGLMKAGVEVNTRDEDGYFGKEDIFAAVKKIMVEVDQEPGKSIRLNKKRWHKFLLKKKVQDKFISDMIVEMKRINHE